MARAFLAPFYKLCVLLCSAIFDLYLCLIVFFQSPLQHEHVILLILLSAITNV